MTGLIPQVDVGAVIFLILPAYTTNAAPILFGGGRQIDFNRRFIDGEPILGGNKTVRGLIGGLAVGVIVSLAQALLFRMELLAMGLLLTIGAVAGDLAGAFLKRRLKIRPGDPLPLVDQLDFMVGAILLTYPVYKIPNTVLMLILLITPPIHLLTNMAAFRLGLKSTFW